MIEIRFDRFSDGLLELLEEKGIMLIEDDFDKKVMYSIYCEEEDKDLIMNFIDSPMVKVVEETGWEEKWKEFLRPGNLTDRIKYIFDSKDFVRGESILINPALAFGTGNHPTTQLAATLLEEVCFGKKVLDVGCGSGILSIAAKLSGASSVYGFDNDSTAIKNTKENLVLNNSEDIIIWAGGAESLKSLVKFDVLVANIISSVLIQLKDFFLGIDPQYFIFSGILKDEMDYFLKTFDNEMFLLDRYIEKDNWVGIRYRRKDD
jgi:ribosomal protein L11 methyltransferase